MAKPSEPPILHAALVHGAHLLDAHPFARGMIQGRLDAGQAWEGLKDACAKAGQIRELLWKAVREGQAAEDAKGYSSEAFQQGRETAERAAAEDERLRDQLMSADAPDLDAVIHKFLLLTRVTDGVVWDFADPETWASVMARAPGSETTRAVASIYLDVVRLAGCAHAADKPIPQAA